MLHVWMIFLSVAMASSPPFWKAKDKVYERVKEGEIIVAVKAEEATSTQKRLTIAGGGQVAAPRDHVLRLARDYNQVARLSGFVEKSVYHSDTGVMDLHLSIFGHHADVKVAVESPASAEPPRLTFRILEGPMQGLRGQLDFVALGPSKTEVGIEGEYAYTRFPLPRFFLEFGLEVAFQKMAARLRQKVESSYRDGQS